MATKRRSSLGGAASFHLWLLSVQLIAAAVMLTVAGCSTAPYADFLDFCSPGHFPAAAKTSTGGVCIPQGASAGGVLGCPPAVGPPVVAPVGPFGPPGVPDAPPPVPIGLQSMPGGAKSPVQN